MKNKEVLRKLILILGIANATFGSILNNHNLLIIGGIISIVGTMMVLNLIW